MLPDLMRYVVKFFFIIVKNKQKIRSVTRMQTYYIVGHGTSKATSHITKSEVSYRSTCIQSVSRRYKTKITIRKKESL